MASPGNRMRWDITVSDVPIQADKLIEQTRVIYDAVGTVKNDDVSFENVIKVSAIYSVERD